MVLQPRGREVLDLADGLARPPGSNIDSSGHIDASFLREAGLEEAFKKSRAEAEKIVGKVAEG